MSRRFTDTEKWKDEWFLPLSNDQKIIWLYVLDNCSIAGILKKNFKMLNFCCGTQVDEESFLGFFKDRVIDCGSFFFIPKFVKYQYPKGLNSDKPAIVSVRNELCSFGVVFIIKKLFGNDYLIVKDKDKDKDKDKGITPAYKNETLAKVAEWKKQWELENKSGRSNGS